MGFNPPFLGAMRRSCFFTFPLGRPEVVSTTAPIGTSERSDVGIGFDSVNGQLMAMNGAFMLLGWYQSYPIVGNGI